MIKECSFYCGETGEKKSCKMTFDTEYGFNNKNYTVCECMGFKKEECKIKRNIN
jgi:hypothetical protein